MKASTLPKTRQRSETSAAWLRRTMQAACIALAAWPVWTGSLAAQQTRFAVREKRAATSQTSSPTDSVAVNQSSADRLVSLNHFHASWTSVLEGFAKQIGCELVMPDVPPGHFSRRDASRYSLADALRILNGELEIKGYHVAIRGKYLLVLDLESTRTRYPQPVIPQPLVSQNRRSNEFNGQPQREHVTQNNLSQRENPLTGNSLGQNERSAENTTFRNSATKFNQAAAIVADADGETIVHNGAFLEDNVQTLPLQRLETAPELRRVFRIPSGNRKPSQMAQRIFAACGPSAVLLKPKPDQLLACRIHFREPIDPQSRFDSVINVWVDKADRELSVECLPAIAEHVNRLLQYLATAATGDQEFIHLISVVGDASATAAKVRSSLAQVAWQESAEQVPNQNHLGISQTNRARQLSPIQESVRPQSADLQAIVDQIRGDVEIVTIDELGVMILQGTDNDVAAVRQLIAEIEKAARTELQMRIFPLRNARADELTEIINSAIQSVVYGRSPSASANAQPATNPQNMPAGGQMQIAASVMLQFLSSEGAKSGVLANIQVTSDPRTNSLLVSAPQQSMPMMASLIRQLDIPAPTVADIKVFTLSNADAREMARLLDSLFASQSQQQATGVQLAGAVDAGSNLVPTRFTVDARTNSIIAKGSAEALRVAEAVLLRLDQNDLRQRRNHVFRLRNSPAPELAEAINAFLGSKRDLAEADPQLVSTIEQLEREVIVVAESITNSLLISSTPRFFDEIQALVQQLDQPAAQVNIQVLLVEVELDSNDEFGIELGIQDPVLFQRSVIDDLVTITTSQITPLGVPVTSEQIVSQTSTPGFLFNNRPLGNNTTVRPGAVGSQGLSNFSLGRSNSSLGYGGLVLSASSEAVSVLVRALAARRNVHILSRPQIRTLDNQLAQIQVGQQVPIVDGVTVSQNNAATPLVRQDKAGIILTVTPRINPDGTVVMEVIAEKSQFAGENVPLFVNSDGSTVGSPVKNITSARATVSVPNGQTIVLGGMITKVDVTDERKVPVLGDIPLLGRAFRYDASSTKRTELLMFLTPRVIRDPFESENIKRVEAERMHFFVEEAEKIHGPLFAVPESMPFSETIIEEVAPPDSNGSLPPVYSVDQQ